MLLQSLENFINNSSVKFEYLAAKFAQGIALATNKETFFLKYAGFSTPFRSANAGDELAPYVYRALTGQKSPARVEFSNPLQVNNYMTVGSILQFADVRTVVWGTGFVRERAVFGCTNWSEAGETGIQETRVKPKEIRAVRGPLTRKRVLEIGIDCPEIYGDPGYLMPLFYQSHRPKDSVLGLIPHFTHLDSPYLKKLASSSQECKLISVFQDPEKFIDSIVSCEFIASSSLHGLILADAYNIPSLWVMPQDFLHHRDFKYLDYLASIKSSQADKFILNSDTTARDIIAATKNIYKERLLVKPLLEACPFINKEFVSQ